MRLGTYRTFSPTFRTNRISEKKPIWFTNKNKPLFPALFVLFLLAQPVVSQACELKFNISGEKKEVYKVGEEVIVEVEIVYTHRTCEIQLSDTKFTYEGMKILGATAWKEKAPNTFSRQIKISLPDDSLPEAKLNIVRKCSKEGAIGSFKISKSK